MNLSGIFKLNLTTRLFWIIATVVMFAVGADTVMRYKETIKIAEARGHSRAKALQDYFVSMRFVYQQQFLKSGIDLNDSTVGFLPAHAASLISDEFSKRTTQGITIRNVSDQPRNPNNKADSYEAEAIAYFDTHPKENELIRTIEQNGTEYMFFSSPLRVVKYCLVCHGDKKDTIEYVRHRYDTGFGYKIGDIRGLTSIKIPKKELLAPMMKLFWDTTFLIFGASIGLLAIIYIAIYKLTHRESRIKERLKQSVKEKTFELQTAYLQEKHLLSVLRTVADVNQLLITTKNVDELVDKTAKILSSNPSFLGVKIMLAQNGKLEIKAACGIASEQTVTDIDNNVFSFNKAIMISDMQSENIPEYCRQKAEVHGIKAIYSIPLRSSVFVKEPIGVLTICTAMEDGFLEKDKDMLDELAGDIGFAVNSFLQQDVIERLHDEKLKSYQEFIGALVDMIEKRDTYTAGHTKRVAKYSLMIATELGISQDEKDDLFEAAKLHDIGKIVTPDSILLKPGSLTTLEYELIKEHVTAGYQVLSNIDSYKDLAEIVLSHHERYDGSGYPHGKKGDEVSLSGHILAVADSFDAMTTNRIYKPKMSVSKSLEELKTLSGSLYHPDVVTAAVKVLEDVDIEQVEDQAIGGNEIDKERLSYFFKDRLTKLYNEDYLTLAINGRSGYQSPKSLTIVSISNFTKYNKEYTWEGGNSLLVGFAEFLTKQLGMCIVFRVWGDHFVIADCELDMALIMKDSPLAKAGVAYKIKTVKAPFENIKETLLRT